MADELAELLGIDMNDPQQRLACQLTENDSELIHRLADARRDAGLTRAQVADRMGTTADLVEAFECEGDPRLSTIRRYVLAVGVRITTSVEVHRD